MDSAPIVNIRHNGIGDVVVASWIVHSALAVNREVRVNPGDQRQVATLFGVPDACLTSAAQADWLCTPGFGHLEFQLAPTTPISRFDAWCRSLNLPRLDPVRPPYCEVPADGDWADQQWQTVDATSGKRRVLLFPEAAWATRMWPLAYFIDLAAELADHGFAVAAMAGSQAAVKAMPCHWWGGFSVRQAAAMSRRAHLVVANESGPAHLASAVETQTIAICGPTDPHVVFAHEPHVKGVRLDTSVLPCVGCHFAASRGYRAACDVGGCQALMRLDPAKVGAEVRLLLASL